MIREVVLRCFCSASGFYVYMLQQEHRGRIQHNDIHTGKIHFVFVIGRGASEANASLHRTEIAGMRTRTPFTVVKVRGSIVHARRPVEGHATRPASTHISVAALTHHRDGRLTGRAVGLAVVHRLLVVGVALHDLVLHGNLLSGVGCRVPLLCIRMTGVAHVLLLRTRISCHGVYVWLLRCRAQVVVLLLRVLWGGRLNGHGHRQVGISAPAFGDVGVAHLDLASSRQRRC
jgi:hypothetical protein